MTTIQTRIEALEKAMEPVFWEPVRLMRYVQDRLSMILHSGTPTKPGRKYSREPEETEEAFLERAV